MHDQAATSADPVPATPGELATLWVDEPGAVFNVALLSRFAAGPFIRSDGSVDTGRVRAEVARRTVGVPALRRRLTGGRHPVWVLEEVRPDEHVQCDDLPEGADLLGWCAERIFRPLDPERPLWRIDVVGLPGGEFALLLVAHHVLVDGRRGAAVLRSLLDPPPDAADGQPVRGVRPPTRAVRRWDQLRHAVADLWGRAPVTSLSRAVGHGPRIVAGRADLGDLRTVGSVYGATVNDLLLAAVTAGLRALLLHRGDVVADLTLRASVPMSSGSEGQPEGMLLVALPVGEPDPLQRLARIRETTVALKQRLRSGGGTVFDVLRLPTPLARAAVRSLRRIAGRGINLFVTDIPGPTEPLDLSGAPLLSALPVAPLTANVPLGIAALSYAGTLWIGVNADAALTDVDVLGRAMEREIATLVAAARCGTPLPSTPTDTLGERKPDNDAPEDADRGGDGPMSKRWKDLSPTQQTAILVLGSLQLSLAATAWTDLLRRPAAEVNGSKGLWAAVIAVNWIGPLSYFRWGRRR